MKRIFFELAETINQGVPCAFGEVIETKGSSPQKPGAKAVFRDNGQLSGTLGAEGWIVATER